MSTEDNLQEPLFEHSSTLPELESSEEFSRKRKRRPEPERALKDAATRGKRKKAKAIEEDEMDVDAGLNNAFSHMDSQLLADYVAHRTRRYESDLSLVELEDKNIPGIVANNA